MLARDAGRGRRPRHHLVHAGRLGVRQHGKSVPSGYDYCVVDSQTGFVHRVEAIEVAVDPYGDPDDACNPEGMSAGCKTNADCGEGSVCEYDGIWGGCDCVDKCRTDADCGTGLSCIPNLVPLAKTESGMTCYSTGGKPFQCDYYWSCQ